MITVPSRESEFEGRERDTELHRITLIAISDRGRDAELNR